MKQNKNMAAINKTSLVIIVVVLKRQAQTTRATLLLKMVGECALAFLLYLISNKT
jgi:hypothetical protein